MEDDRSKCTSDLRQPDPGRSFGWRAAELSRITHGVGGKVEGVQGNDKKAKDMQEWVGGIDDKIDQVNGSGSPTSSRTAFPSKSPARYPHREPYTRPVTRSPFLCLGFCPCHAGRAQRFFKAVIDYRLPFVEGTDLQQTEVLSRTTLDTEPENAFPRSCCSRKGVLWFSLPHKSVA
jgi:hypothetical protein